MVIKHIFASICFIGLAACSTERGLMNSVGDVLLGEPITMEKSSFDQSTSVKMRETILFSENEKYSKFPYALGASWNSVTPNKVTIGIFVSMEALTGVRGAATIAPTNEGLFGIGGVKTHEPANGVAEILINVDGVLTSLKQPLPDMSKPMTAMQMNTKPHEFTIPLDLVQKMLLAKDCKIRIKSMASGYDRDILFSKDIANFTGARTARPLLKEFVAIIEKESLSTGQHKVLASSPTTKEKQIVDAKSNGVDKARACAQQQADIDAEWNARSEIKKAMPYQRKPRARCDNGDRQLDPALARNTTDKMIASNKSGERVSLQINGSFEGWKNPTRLAFSNGEVWEQVENSGPTSPYDLTNPTATIYSQKIRNGDKIAIVFNIVVDKVERAVRVKRIQ